MGGELLVHSVWQVLALIQRILKEGKCLTQRDAYYTLIQHFKHQSEFNDTLQGLSPTHTLHTLHGHGYLYTDIVALTGCARSSLGMCASSSGALAGCVLWKASPCCVAIQPLVRWLLLQEEGVEPLDCSESTNGKTVSPHLHMLTLQAHVSTCTHVTVRFRVTWRGSHLNPWVPATSWWWKRMLCSRICVASVCGTVSHAWW